MTQLVDDDAGSGAGGAGALQKRSSTFDGAANAGVRQLPVIKESASKILENSPNTLQKTLLIKREVEVYKREKLIMNYDMQMRFL